jgi:prepilin-type N-terminal cleavage/methylation domain-containing protein/prepilin-type processing-associated H-X9-DG protein
MPSPSHHRFAATRGFTLIELLVVISIIAILASMLLPAIGMIRDLAQSAKCASSQRQYGLANAAYANENEGLTIPVNRTDALGQWTIWTYNPSVQQYVDGSLDEAPTALYTMGRTLRWASTCPSVPTDGRELSNIYAMPVTLRQWGLVFTPNAYASEPLDQIAQPSQTALLFDAVEFMAHRWMFFQPPEDVALGFPLGPGPMARHRDKFNTVYYDGHTASVRATDVYDQPWVAGSFYERMMPRF